MMEISNVPPATRIAIVTGGARGIGAAISARLAADGHDIGVLDLNASACEETVRLVEAAGRRAVAVAADVADEAAVRKGVATVAKALGAPTVLINNAGILRARSLGKMSISEWDSVIDVNLRSVFLMSREVLPHMRAARWGRVVNLASIAALGVPGEANYSAAKAGVIGFTRTMAIEVGRYGITANVVAPGFILTNMNRELAQKANISFEDMTREMMRDIHVGRPGEPEDIAHAVAFFADPRSEFVTGQTLYVAGGPRG